MFAYVLKRIVYMIPTLFGISIIAFIIIQLPPGDYLISMIARMQDSGETVDPASWPACARSTASTPPSTSNTGSG